MINFFTFDGQSSADFGVYISGGGTYNAPERDVTTYSVPGRNGDLIVDNGRFSNITVSYEAFIVRDFSKNAERLRLWLKSKHGYKRLEDSYHTDFFRMAYLSSTLDFSTGFLNWNASFTVILYFLKRFPSCRICHFQFISPVSNFVNSTTYRIRNSPKTIGIKISFVYIK